MICDVCRNEPDGEADIILISPRGGAEVLSLGLGAALPIDRIAPATLRSPRARPIATSKPAAAAEWTWVKHIQDNQGGTRSEIICCIQTGLTGGGDAIGF